VRLESEGLFLVQRLEGLTPPAFREMIDRSESFALKVDYCGLPPPIEELDLVHLIPARRSELPRGTLVLWGDTEGFEFFRISALGHASGKGEEGVARVAEVERPGVLIRLDSWRWKLLGFLLTGIPGFPQAYECWRRFSSFVWKLLRPFPCPISLGPPEALARGVIEKYSCPGEVTQQIKLSCGGLEEWEEDLFPRMVPPGGRLLIVGCAAGREAVPLAMQGFKVVGIDPIPALIEAARRHAQAQGVEVAFEVKAAADLDGFPESFDAILCSCYEHIPTRHQRIETLRTLGRLLTPRGVIILTAGWRRNDGLRLALVDGLRQLLRRVLGDRFTTEPGDRLIRHLSLASDAHMPCFYHIFRGPEEIRREVEAAGLIGEPDPEGPWIIRPDNSRNQP
jgi:ubiquinone/menaquinone biosynthesis C-methylase UbiE